MTTIDRNLPAEEYHAHPAFSASMAKVIVTPGGPAKLRWQLDHPQPPRRLFEYGHAAHQLVLGVGPELWPIPAEILASNGAVSTKEAKQFVQGAREAGAVPLKPDEYEQVQAMATALLSEPDAIRALQGDHELSAFTTDTDTGIELRCRFDAISQHSVGDYKTAVNADPLNYARRTMVDLGHHIQAAHYLDMGAALDLLDPDAPFRFVVQEKAEPYMVAVITPDPEYLALGRRQMRRAIDLFAQCTTTGAWPGYGSVTVAPPKWAVDADEALDPSIEAELLALLNK